MGMIVNPYGSAAPITDTYFANVVFLCHADGVDGSTSFTNVVYPTRGNVIAATNGVVSTTAPLYGSGSMAMAGVGIGIASANVAGYDFGTGDFTIEFAFKTSAPAQVANLLDMRSSLGAVPGPTFYISSSEYAYYSNSADQIRGGTVATSTRQRIAADRFFDGTNRTTRLYVEGAVIGSFIDTSNYSGGSITFGAAINDGAPVNPGSFDEMRVTVGVARYQGAYTPAAAPFPDA